MTDQQQPLLTALLTFHAAFREWQRECTNVAFQKVLRLAREVEKVRDAVIKETH